VWPASRAGAAWKCRLMAPSTRAPRPAQFSNSHNRRVLPTPGSPTTVTTWHSPSSRRHRTRLAGASARPRGPPSAFQRPHAACRHTKCLWRAPCNDVYPHRLGLALTPIGSRACTSKQPRTLQKYVSLRDEDGRPPRILSKRPARLMASPMAVYSTRRSVPTSRRPPGRC